MRVSHRSMHAHFWANMNKASSGLLDIYNKVESQKEVNAPSDNPLGTSRILGYRDSLASFAQYNKNMDMANGWLKLADETLVETSNLITNAKGIAEQGSTGTLTASDREILAYNMRQLFKQMISVANTTFNGQSIFAGQDVDEKAYEDAVLVYDGKGGLEPYVDSIAGSVDKSVKVQFLGAAGTTATMGTDDIDYRYTRDGGKSWTTGTLPASPASPVNALDLGDGLVVNVRDGYEVELSPATNDDTDIGTWLTATPTVVYRGTHNEQAAVTIAGGGSENFDAESEGAFEKDAVITIDTAAAGGPVTYHYEIEGNRFPPAGSFSAKTVAGEHFVIELPEGEVRVNGDPAAAAGLSMTLHAKTLPVMQMGSNVNAYANGDLDRPALVRIDNAADVTLGGGGEIEYSYSLDSGRSWVTGKKAPNTANPDLLFPGGHLTLSAKGGSNTLHPGDQFVIQPKSEDIAVDISADNRLAINNVGSDIFGGLIENGSGYYFGRDDEGSNLFVSMGKLIAALENNDQTAIGRGLAELNIAQEKVLNQAADVGARENRITVNKKILSGLTLNQKEQMSNIEDADIAEVMTELNRQEVVYQAVLTSSSRIMKMSLLDYV